MERARKLPFFDKRSICDSWVRTFAAHWWAPQALPKVIPILSLRKQLNLFVIK
jgi:hypothetical protein